MKYLIRETRHFYTGAIHNGRVRYFGKNGFDTTAPLVAFDNKEDAKDVIESNNLMFLLLEHGEYARPTLTVVPTHVASQAARDQLDTQ